ncbi:MAG: hypothetical protein ACJAQ8_001984 [Haliea salexigens]|jgi:hypothetical protein
MVVNVVMEGFRLVAYVSRAFTGHEFIEAI